MTRPVDELKAFLTTLWEEVLGVAPVAADEDFFDLGGDARAATAAAERLQEWLRDYVYTAAIHDAPTVSRMAAYLETHYAQALARPLGRRVEPGAGRRSSQGVDREQLRLARRSAATPGTPPAGMAAGARNRRAVFVLSSPRAGSTLSRVMLAGHPGLFAPPELNLLPFRSLAQRRDACSGRHEFLLEGAIRALMELHGCDAAAATARMEALEGEGTTVAEFYRLVQEWSGERTLVEKSTSYALDLEALRAAEATFCDPLYIHLVRHPCGAIRSFEQVRFDRLFFRGASHTSPGRLGEIVWTRCNANIVEFLESVPDERHRRLRFEDLVTRPEDTMEMLSRFLGVRFDPGMLEPYAPGEGRMTEGIYRPTRMQGDPRFFERDAVTPEVANAWQASRSVSDLDGPARAVAAKLGYVEQRLSICHGPADDSVEQGCLHELFERQVARDPNKVAAVLDAARDLLR